MQCTKGIFEVGYVRGIDAAKKTSFGAHQIGVYEYMRFGEVFSEAGTGKVGTERQNLSTRSCRK